MTSERPADGNDPRGDASPVGVVGAGVMGTGVAQHLAACGHRVVLIDVADAILNRARSSIAREARLQRLLRRSGRPVVPGDLMERISCTLDYGALADCEFVIENVDERWDVKRVVYGRLDEVCRASAVLIANTSCIPIGRIARATGRPEQVVGVHFMNPVPLTETVELVPGPETSAATLRRTSEFLAQIGRQAVIVKDGPGFVSNRILMPAINQAIAVLEEDVASVQDIDRIFTGCFGHKMGPLATADLIGLDTVLASLEVLHDAYGSEQYAPRQRLRDMVAAGRCGRKSGEGFYSYPVWPDAGPGA